jgi:hypothetical protein
MSAIIITLMRSCYAIGLNIRRGTHSYNWSISKPSIKHKWFWFCHQPRIDKIEVEWDNRHQQCCGWSPTSHCQRYEGQ